MVGAHRNVLQVCLVLTLLQGCASYPPSLDERVAVLRSELNATREQLSRDAHPYRSGGRDFFVAASGKPLRATLDKFNSLPEGERTISMSEISAGGRLFNAWTDCLFGTKIGFYIAPLNLRYAMGAIVKVGSLEYVGWPAVNGLQYRLKGTPGAGYATLYGAIEFCGLDVPIVPTAVALGGGTFNSRGDAKLQVKQGVGIGYELQLQDPLVFAGVLYVGGIGTLPIVFPLKPQLFSGTIPNMLGNKGEVQVVKSGQRRSYVLDLGFTDAAFVESGLTASGTISLTWSSPLVQDMSK